MADCLTRLIQTGAPNKALQFSALMQTKSENPLMNGVQFEGRHRQTIAPHLKPKSIQAKRCVKIIPCPKTKTIHGAPFVSAININIAHHHHLRRIAIVVEALQQLPQKAVGFIDSDLNLFKIHYVVLFVNNSLLRGPKPSLQI